MRTDSNASRVLIVIAHPDDETIFMGGLIRRLVAAGRRLDIACATSRFASPLLTSSRRAEFQRACWHLGARAVLLGLEDTPAPLPAIALANKLRVLAEASAYGAVYTHGVWGEYGHRHHRDVCLAVHRVFGDRTYCLAGPLKADISDALSRSELAMKRRFAATIYFSQPGIAGWCSDREQFARVSPALAEMLVAIANGERPLRAAVEPIGADLREGIRRSRAAFDADGTPFPEVAHVPRLVWKPIHLQFAASLASFEASAISQ
jgi:LmbE family N-acetylglucosaminyl deacetylase